MLSTRKDSVTFLGCRLLWCLLAGFVSWPDIGSAQSPERASPPEIKEPTLPEKLPMDAAVSWALQNNPELAAIRQQHGIAAAAVLIAETYPFNPVWEGKIRAASGPTSAGITNRVSNEHKVFIDVETRGQGTYRREGASAALSRTDWDIAFQETALAIRVVRAFDSVIYRQEKLALLEKTVELDQRVVDQVHRLVELGKLRGPDLVLARTEVDDVRSQLGQGHSALVLAKYDLRRALGMVDDPIQLEGKLEARLVAWDAAALFPVALERRADLHSKRAAESEAEARLRLERANRFGNWNIGPAMEYDPTRIVLMGVQVTRPLPVFNRHAGDIQQREAELSRAAKDAQQTEILVRQDVRTALARLDEANSRVYTYRNEILPHLETSIKEIEKLLADGDPSVTAIHAVDTRRKLLKAQDSYLDALWEVKQARADLAAAVGDPAVAVLPWKPAERKEAASEQPK
jgi:outer membrane protein TolC